MLVGYARVSTADQDPALQLAALEEAGCDRIFEETASGSRKDRLELKKAIDYLRADDVLVVWKLDRLARSVKQLVDTVEEFEKRTRKIGGWVDGARLPARLLLPRGESFKARYQG